MLIRAEAEGTDTYELNRNLVLTDGARADSVPNLEIETGEIAGAGHASATGRFDDEQLFYLMARGIPADEARRLVVRGFFAELIQQIGVPDVGERLTREIEAELEASVAMSLERRVVRACALSELPEDAADAGRARRRRRSASSAPRARCSRSTTSARTPTSRSPRARWRTATIECWLHGSSFDLRTGKPSGLPATRPVPVYPVKIEGDDVLVSLTAGVLRHPWPRLKSATCTSPSRRDGTKEILKGVDLTVKQGETHAIMGPNGSGKSTLAYSLAGHPKYTITGGTVPLDGEDVLEMSVDERARAGLFLAMQYPVEVPGVSVSNFLRTSATAIRGEAPKLRTWVKEVKEAMERLHMDPAFAERNVNEGFSGGEKKRHEILQLELLKPKIAILDETDSGLDVDALRVVSEGVNRVRETGEVGTLLITHYTRILRYIKPDFVHVFVGGRIVESGWRRARRQAGERGLRGYAKGGVTP